MHHGAKPYAMTLQKQKPLMQESVSAGTDTVSQLLFVPETIDRQY